MIDSGASSSIMNPNIANKLFPNNIFSHNFEISSIHKVTKGTSALIFPIFQELGDDTSITFLVAPWHSTYNCLIGHKGLYKLEANIDWQNQIFSTSKFEINYLKNIQSKSKGMKMNHHQESATQIRTSHMNSEEKDQITLLCRKYSDCFYNEEEKLSATTAVTHVIRTKDEDPIYVKNFRYPYALKEEIPNQVKKLLKDGIIRPSESPYSSPVWIVPKKPDPSEKRKWRMINDYRKLNDKTIEDKYPLPRMDEILENLEKFSYFSTLDPAQGFHQLPVDKNAIEKTTFTVENGHYEYTRMPFGLKNAPATF